MSGDALARARALSPALGMLAQSLLGCAWGREVGTVNESEPCPAQAVRMVTVHDTPYGDITLKLCQRHYERVSAGTDPHG